MRIGVPKETAPGERRVALVPEVVGKLKAKGQEIVVQRGAGTDALVPDAAFADAGAQLTDSAGEIWGSDVVVTISPPQPEHGSVDRHAERPIAGRLRGGDKLPCCRAIASKVKLVPQARTSSACHLADCPR